MTQTLVRQATVTPQEDARRRVAYPVGASVTVDDLGAADCAEVVAELRSAEPVSWVPAIGGWLVTSRGGAREFLGRNAPVTVEAEENLVRASLGRMMLTVDGDEHARMRKPLEWPFRVNTVRELFGAEIAELADDLVDGFAESGEVVLDDAFAMPFAVRMSGQSLGLSFAEIERIDAFYSAFAGAMVYDGDPAPVRAAEAARAELDEILLSEIARGRANSGHSLTSVLAQDSRGLTDQEIADQLRVVMFGAIETIQASVLSTVYLLLQHPDQADAVRADPTLLDGAQEEARRLIPPVAFVERWTREDFAVAGVTIPAHEFVGVSVVATNRDPETFEDPDRFDIRRTNANKGLSFSFGPHACLGIHMARLQTTIAVESLLSRLPGLTLVDADAPTGFTFRRPTSVRVRWS